MWTLGPGQDWRHPPVWGGRFFCSKQFLVPPMHRFVDHFLQVNGNIAKAKTKPKAWLHIPATELVSLFAMEVSLGGQRTYQEGVMKFCLFMETYTQIIYTTIPSILLLSLCILYCLGDFLKGSGGNNQTPPKVAQGYWARSSPKCSKWTSNPAGLGSAKVYR